MATNDLLTLAIIDDDPAVFRARCVTGFSHRHLARVFMRAPSRTKEGDKAKYERHR